MTFAGGEAGGRGVGEASGSELGKSGPRWKRWPILNWDGGAIRRVWAADTPHTQTNPTMKNPRLPNLLSSISVLLPYSSAIFRAAMLMLVPGVRKIARASFWWMSHTSLSWLVRAS